MTEQDVTVRSVSRAVSILRAFRATDRWLSLGEIAARTKLDKATTHRLLHTLMAELLVEHDPATKSYSLDIGVLELAAGVTPYGDLRQLAQPVLAAIASATGATTFLAIVHDDEALCIGRVDGDEAIQIRSWSVGGRIPLNAGAGPRVLMANLPRGQRARLLASPLPRITTATPNDASGLDAILDTVRLRRWELGVDDVMEGVASLAVPMHDRGGACIATISIAGLHSHILDGEQPRHLAILQSKTRELEMRLPP